MLGTTCTETLTQADRIANRAQRLIGHNYAEIGGVERLPIRGARDSRHVRYNVVKLSPQNPNQLVNRLGGEFRGAAQWLFRAKHEQASP